MTVFMAIQILLTVVVTGACTWLLATYVDVAKEKIRLKKYFVLLIKVLFVTHAIVFPAAIINLIWSF